MGYRGVCFFLLAVLGTTLSAGPADAARVRFHYAPDAAGNLQLQPAPGGTVGENTYRTGAARSYPCPPPQPNRLLTVRQPYTRQELKIPVFLPDGVPEIEHTWTRTVYNYGIYTVEIRFLADGSVDLIYNSGFFRPL